MTWLLVAIWFVAVALAAYRYTFRPLVPVRIPSPVHPDRDWSR
jgi:hypothetical protein